MNQNGGAPLASTLVRKVFSVYIALAILLTAIQIGAEYRNTYDNVFDELGTTARAFEPGISVALWNYQTSLLESMAKGMVQGGVVTGVSINDKLERFKVRFARDGQTPPDHGLSRGIDLFHDHSSGKRELIGSLAVYSSHEIVVERVKLGVILILVGSVIKTAGLWIIMVFFANRLLAGPLKRFTGQIESFSLANATQPPSIDIGHAPSAELIYLRDTFRNLMEREIANQQLAVKKEAAEASNRAKSQFLAAASHDLRQPLHALTLFVAALRRYVERPEGLRLMAQIKLSLQALEGLLTALLDVSRLDAGAVRPEIYDFPLQVLVDRLHNDYEPPAKQKGLNLYCPASDLIVRSDPHLLERILRNYLSNAIRYTETGHVWLRATAKDGFVRIEVSDTGKGIPKDKHREIYREFYQLENPERDRTKGLGLGLSIVERLARLLEHPIGVTSEPGRGSVFSVSVPEGNSMTAHREKEGAEINADRPGTIDLTGMLVLVIDDEKSVRESMETLFKQWGCEPLLVASEDEAIEQLRVLQRTPDTIIADYRLAEERTGAQAIQRVHQECGELIPALIMTGDTAPDRLRQAIESGYELLHKPASPEQLRAFLDKARAADGTNAKPASS